MNPSSTYPVFFSNCSRAVSVIFSLVLRSFSVSTWLPPNFFSIESRPSIVSYLLLHNTISNAKRTLVEVVFLLAAGTGAAAGVAAGAAAAAELGCETGEFVHDGDIQVKDIPSQSVSSKVYSVGGGI